MNLLDVPEDYLPAINMKPCEKISYFGFLLLSLLREGHDIFALKVHDL